MSSAEGAQKAIERMNGKSIDGRALTVNLAKPLEERSSGVVAFWCCLIGLARRSSTMTSLHRHGAKEAYKQIHFRMKKSGLTTIKVSVTRKFGKLNVQFSGSGEEVSKAQKILADWA